jgi:hypothetical protein
MVKAIAPNAPIGVARTMMRMMPKNIFAMASIARLILSEREPRREIANPERIDTSKTCRRSPLANAPTKVSGTIASRWATMPCSFAWVT